MKSQVNLSLTNQMRDYKEISLDYYQSLYKGYKGSEKEVIYLSVLCVVEQGINRKMIYQEVMYN